MKIFGFSGLALKERMTFFVYILQSDVDGSFYIGQTQDLIKRLEKHNKGLNRSTKLKRPWKVKFSKIYSTRSEAYKIEQYLKSLKRRASIVKWIEENNGV